MTAEPDALFTAVWPDPGPSVRAEAQALWARLGVLPPGVDPEARAAQLCVVGHAKGRLIAVSSAEVAYLPILRQRFAMLRVFVDPEVRSGDVLRRLARSAHARLEDWSSANPGERVMGMGAVFENPRLGKVLPVWRMRPGDSPMSGLVLVGYTERGEQIRVSWFKHARL